MVVSKLRSTHGMRKTPTYRIWAGVVSRTTRKTDRAYQYYGARGIHICERWRTFENFLADMGERPEGMTIERIDNERGYEPGNCRWATMHEQQNNKRNNVLVELHGERMTLAQAARALGINYFKLHAQIARGICKCTVPGLVAVLKQKDSREEPAPTTTKEHRMDQNTETRNPLATITLFPVESTRIAAAGYNPDTKELAISFKDARNPDRVYRYQGVSEANWEGFQSAESKGTYLHGQIMPFHGFVRVDANGEVDKEAPAPSTPAPSTPAPSTPAPNTAAQDMNAENAQAA